MRRRAFKILWGAWLLMGAAVVGLWVTSYGSTPGVVHERPGRTSFAGVYRGRLMFETAGRVDTGIWPGWRGLGAGVGLVAPSSETLVIDAPGVSQGVQSRRLLGFQLYTRKSTVAPTAGWVWTVPLWFVTAVLAVLPLGAYLKERREGRRRRMGFMRWLRV